MEVDLGGTIGSGLVCGTFVTFAADHPEMNRIVVWESASESDRLTWLVENHTRKRYDQLLALVEPLQTRGIVRKIPPTSFYYLVVGGASLPFVAAAEAKHYSGLDPTDPAFVEAHARALETLIFENG